nr:hypothetical protein CFP56_62597 [Quercus suber]
MKLIHLVSKDGKRIAVARICGRQDKKDRKQQLAFGYQDKKDRTPQLALNLAPTPKDSLETNGMMMVKQIWVRSRSGFGACCLRPWVSGYGATTPSPTTKRLLDHLISSSSSSIESRRLVVMRGRAWSLRPWAYGVSASSAMELGVSGHGCLGMEQRRHPDHETTPRPPHLVIVLINRVSAAWFRGFGEGAQDKKCGSEKDKGTGSHFQKLYRVDVQSYHFNIVLAAAVGNAIRKDLGSSGSSSVVSKQPAKCKNECDDEDDQAKYLSSKFKV